MKKKILFLLCSCVAMSYQVQAQNPSAAVNPKIAAIYGTHLNAIIAQDPQRLEVLNQLLNERIVIMDQDSVSAKQKFPALLSQPLFNKYVPDLTADAVYNPNTFNPLKYDLPFFTYGDAGYWINGTNKVLLIRGMRNFTNQ